MIWVVKTIRQKICSFFFQYILVVGVLKYQIFLQHIFSLSQSVIKGGHLSCVLWWHGFGAVNNPAGVRRRRWWCWRGFCSRPLNLTYRWSTPTCSCCATSSSSKVRADKYTTTQKLLPCVETKSRVSFCLVVVGEKNKVCKVLQMAWTFVNDRWGMCSLTFIQCLSNV